jgi:hypothetical protein
MILVRGPEIVPHEVVCLHVLERALSPIVVSLLLYVTWIEHLLLLHERPGDDEHLSREG